MIAGSLYVSWQKRFGLLTMVLFAATLLALADALVGGLKGGHSTIELIPGSQYALSGPMPPRTEAIQEFVIDGEPRDGSVRLVPQTIFSGFWFGGSMWRGFLEVSATASPGLHTLAVKDPHGEKQNPTLVFNVQIWPDQATRNANSPSRLTRLTGISPFIIAATLCGCGLLAGLVNFLLGRLWARHLAVHHCGEIYKLRKTGQGTEITCEINCIKTIRPHTPCTIYRPSGEAVCMAEVTSCEGNEVLLLITHPEPVRLGDVACIHLQEGAVLPS